VPLGYAESPGSSAKAQKKESCQWLGRIKDGSGSVNRLPATAL
jgi:hypothetical protein